jgi:hypothetical protein
MSGAIHPLPQYAFMAWCLVKSTGTTLLLPLSTRSRDSSVEQRWATSWTIGGSSPGWGWEYFSSPPRPDRLWGPPSLLSNGYGRGGGAFPGGKTVGA